MDPQKIVGYFGVGEGMRVADFGSGAGYFTIFLARAVGEGGVVTAIDILDTALEILRAKAKAEGLKNIETIRSNLEVPGGSGLNSDSQDIVLLANIFFQSQMKAEIIAEARRTLKPGGSLIVIDWRKGTGGFGPPDDLRVDHEELHRTIAGSGFQFSNEIDAGIFHFGQVYKKL